jgi:cation:H+ antiporter
VNVLVYIGLLIVSFVILAKSADVFVDSSVGIAETLRVPKIIIGIVLMGFATTAPEFAVSVQSAYLGHPEIALGNAVGSVICDDGLALALAAIVAPAPILVNSRVLKTTGIFLVSIYFLAYVMAWNGTFGRPEGMVLVFLLAGYICFIIIVEIRRRRKESTSQLPGGRKDGAPAAGNPEKSLGRRFLYFSLSLAGIILASRLVLWSSINFARYFNIPEVIIGLTAIAIGTSLPEIVTCIVAAKKGEGEIAVGDILGADILNVLWIIGVSSVVNPMHVSTRIINFMFPWMLLIVGTMLVSMRIGYRLGKTKGSVLLSLYAIYLFTTIKVFY